MRSILRESSTTQAIEYYQHRARQVAQRSPDPKKQVGAILVTPSGQEVAGFNRFPKGVKPDKEKLLDKDYKLPRIVHAEQDAIDTAARLGVALAHSTLYVTDAPCSRCAASLMQAGVDEIVRPPVDKTSRFYELWKEPIEIGNELFSQRKPTPVKVFTVNA